MSACSFIRFHHAGDITVKAGHRLGPRVIADFELVYFPIGNGTVYDIDGMEHMLNAPCALLTRPGEPHTYAFDPALPTRHLFIHFDVGNEALHERYPLLSRGTPAIVQLHNQSLVPQMMKQMLYYFHTQPGRWRFLCEMLFLSVLEELESEAESGTLNTEETAMPHQIYHAMKYMEDHLAEKMEIERLARHVGWSHEHFTRTFQQHVGHTPKAWMTKRKIERAAQLLLQRSDSVKEIAREIGFGDEYYFHRLFRRWMGMTATEHRRKYGDLRFRELAPPDDWGRFYPLNHFFALDADRDP
ncbi:AraC family transcriptional regulator [Paenibacillus alkalitolerans]|uniref:AraC family transcriptional regulator n=1 Tax=Paenibacillus alkalitolerans TaxID=2799335 RepID=UPI0018F3A2EA|nr:AraC family transcriptional regulator [Paenibacillus alkalitolerans]